MGVKLGAFRTGSRERLNVKGKKWREAGETT
jgi:hypothetical protein